MFVYNLRVINSPNLHHKNVIWGVIILPYKNLIVVISECQLKFCTIGVLFKGWYRFDFSIEYVVNDEITCTCIFIRS